MGLETATEPANHVSQDLFQVVLVRDCPSRKRVLLGA